MRRTGFASTKKVNLNFAPWGAYMYLTHFLLRLNWTFLLYSAKEEEKRRLQRRNSDLISEKSQLENKNKQMNDSLTVGAILLYAHQNSHMFSTLATFYPTWVHGSWDLITFYTTWALNVFQPLPHLTQPELKAFQPLPLYTRAELKGFQPF